MGVIIEIDGIWHEADLIILLLQKQSLDRKELKARLRNVQQGMEKEGRVAWGPHSYSAYNYWIKSLKKSKVIDENNRVLSLTELGRWIASSELGDIHQRDSFARLICEKCSNYNVIVFRTPIVSSTSANSKGDPFMDIRCPKCGSLSEQNNLGDIGSEHEFVKFYNEALDDLAKFVKLEARKI